MRDKYPDNKVHGSNKGPTWALSDPDGPHVGPTKLAIRVHFGSGRMSLNVTGGFMYLLDKTNPQLYYFAVGFAWSNMKSEIIPGMGSANDKRRYYMADFIPRMILGFFLEIR